MTTNRQVCRAWAMGILAHSGHMMTDGRCLWSYGLMIGATDDRKKVLRRYQAPKHFVSMTTSCHVGQASGYADVVLDDWEEA